MKTNMMLFWLLVLNLGIALNASTNYEDVVYLNNGSIIRGIIIEQVPNKSIKLQTRDGNIFVYKIDEVEKITKEINNKNASFGRKGEGFFSYQRLGVMFAEGYDESVLSIGSINGKRINEKFRVGFGIEFNDYPNASVLPLFLHMKVNYTESNFSPTSYIDVGYSLGWMEERDGTSGNGLFVGLGGGFEALLNKNIAFNIDIGWRKQWSKTYVRTYYWETKQSFDDYYEEEKDIDFNLFSLMLGISF